MVIPLIPCSLSSGLDSTSSVRWLPALQYGFCSPGLVSGQGVSEVLVRLDLGLINAVAPEGPPLLFPPRLQAFLVLFSPFPPLCSIGSWASINSWNKVILHVLSPSLLMTPESTSLALSLLMRFTLEFPSPSLLGPHEGSSSFSNCTSPGFLSSVCSLSIFCPHVLCPHWLLDKRPHLLWLLQSGNIFVSFISVFASFSYSQVLHFLVWPEDLCVPFLSGPATIALMLILIVTSWLIYLLPN